MWLRDCSLWLEGGDDGRNFLIPAGTPASEVAPQAGGRGLESS